MNKAAINILMQVFAVVCFPFFWSKALVVEWVDKGDGKQDKYMHI